MTKKSEKPTPIQSSDNRVSELNNQLEELKKQVAELTAGWQRTQADFVNFRNRVEGEKQAIRQRTKADLILAILPTIDHFQLSVRHLPTDLKDNSWIAGILHIEKQLLKVLVDQGVEPVVALRQKFDPNIHEAIETLPSEKPEDEIIAEEQIGYFLDGQLLRPSRVKVSRGQKS
jgi:molecular chaperone GrpE